MQTVDILRDDELFVTIKPDDNSVQKKVIMGENSVTIQFSDSRFIDFKINDYCFIFGERYILTAAPTSTKLSKYKFNYTLTFNSEGYLISRIQYMFLGDDNTLKESDFSLMGTARDFMNLLMQNIAREQTGWILGEVEDSIYKNMTFKTENCFNALGRIATEFGTEFWIEGKMIHLAKRYKDTGYTFRHGQDLGLKEITPQPINGGGVVTRLYAYGSEKNLPGAYRNFSRRLKLPTGTDFLEKNVDKYGVIEFTKIFEDIFPNRTGTVTGINGLDPFVFSDLNMDFDLNAYLLGGLTAKITFNTGQLSGYTFDIRSYNNSIKEFRILTSKDEKTLSIPDESIRPAIGDKYVLVDIALPQSYIDAAESKLKTEAQKVIDLISEPQINYAITFDPIYLKRKKIVPAIGNLIWITDYHYQLDRRIRITSTTRNIVKENEISVDVADQLSAGKIDTIISTGSSNSREIDNLSREINNNPTLKENRAIGDFQILQGTLVIDGMPTTASMTGFSDLVIENATGKIYRKV
jgi:hypothetical protein